MTKPLALTVFGGALAWGTLALSRQVRERRRHLALQPIGISSNADMTFKRCRRDATIRRRAVLYRGDAGSRSWRSSSGGSH
jgi:hypothetical protein